METARAHLRAVLRYECYAPLEPWLRAADRATTSAMLAKAAETPTSAAEALSRAAALLCLSEHYERTHHLTTDDFHTLLSDVGGPAPVRAEALRLFHELHMGSPPVYVPLEDWLGFTQRHDVAEALRKTAAFALLPCAQEERGASVGA